MADQQDVLLDFSGRADQKKFSGQRTDQNFFWSSHWKNPTKHPVDLPPLTLGHLKNFLISIFEFIDFLEADNLSIKGLEPFGLSTFKS